MFKVVFYEWKPILHLLHHVLHINDQIVLLALHDYRFTWVKCQIHLNYYCTPSRIKEI